MPILNSVAKLAFKPIPRIIPAKSRAGLDYLIAGSFFACACGLWRRNKRAALAAIISGVAELGVAMLTDYPGGPKREISFNARRDIDVRLGSMTAAMPELFGFKKDPARRLFHAQGAVITAISELTQFPEESRHKPHSMRRSSAA
jgi:hypothetical protein